MTYAERRGQSVYGSESGPGTAEHIAECHSVERAQLIVDALNAYSNKALQCVIAGGNPFDGLTLYGPFSDPETANKWAEDARIDFGEWYNVKLNAPQQ